MDMKNKSKWPLLKTVTVWLNWSTEHIRLIKGHCPPSFIDRTLKRRCGCGGNRLPASIALNAIFLKRTISILFLRLHILWHSSSRLVWNHVLINVQRGLRQRWVRSSFKETRTDPIEIWYSDTWVSLFGLIQKSHN
jgi:hypothetical protein